MASAVLLLLCFVAVCAAVPSEKILMKFDARAFGELAPASARSIAPCTAGGAACDPTCRKTGLCIQSGALYTFRETADCGSQYCNPDDPVAAVCASSRGSCVPNTEDIGCDTTGVFPDLYDCHNALTCISGQLAQSTRICDDDLAYDACTGYCDVALANKTCNPQTAICKIAGQFGNVAYNDRLYYYCVQDSQAQLHPVVGRCERGFFDHSTVSCTVSEKVGCRASNSEVPEPITTTTTDPPTTTTTTDPPTTTTTTDPPTTTTDPPTITMEWW